MNHPTDEKLYLLVAHELSVNKHEEALWNMAFALENGDEAKTKAHYIRLRVAQLRGGLETVQTPQPAVGVTTKPQSSPPPQPYIRVDMPRATAADQPDLLNEYRAVVGEKNLDYYLARFAEFDDQGSGMRASWNWAAFLWNVPWAFYRKLYGWGFGLALPLAAIDGALGKYSPIAALVLTLMVLIPFGFFANSLYWKKCNKKIQQARSTNRDEQRALVHLQQHGGVHGWIRKVAITLAVVTPVLGIVASILIPKYTKPGLTRQLPASASSPNVSAPASQQGKTPSNLLAEADAAYARQDYVAERAALLVLANQGDAEAQKRLGDSYNSSIAGRTDQDNKEALRWYLAAARQGLASSQIAVGDMYKSGLGTSKDLTQAVEWYRMAADQGDASGYFWLGRSYHEGEGVQQDYKEASKWFRLAVQKENGGSGAAWLADLYLNGHGVPLSVVAAYALLTAARANCQRAPSFVFCNLDDEQIENTRRKLTSIDFRQAGTLANEMSEAKDMLGPLDRFVASR